MAQRLRILALVTDAYGAYGGISQFNRDLCAALSESPLVEEVVILPRSGLAVPTSAPQRIKQLPPIANKWLYSAQAIRTYATDRQFDTIFCGHLFLAPLAQLIAQFAKIPLWLQLHGIEAWDALPMARRPLERAALVTSVSRYTRQRVLQWADVNPACFRVLPNTVRPLFFESDEISMDCLPRFGLADRKIVLTVSRIDSGDEYKGHTKIITAMQAVRQKHPEAVYAIVGCGNYRAHLESHASENGVSDVVRFLGRLSDNDVRALYRSSHVFAMPSTKEGFGIVFLEAAACGLPVIAGNRDGSRDALAEGALGTLIDPNNAAELETAICDGLEGRLPRIGHGALRRFSTQNFNKHVHDLIQTLH